MTFESTIQDVIPRTASVKSFRVNVPQPVNFKAGQFMEVAIRIDGQEAKKYFTISSPPTEKQFIEFTKRITASVFSQALSRMSRGDWIKISMPLGRFTLERADGKIAFLSGGIGITPIRSICAFVTDQKVDRDVILIYGNHNQADIPFRDEFDTMQAHLPHLRVVHVLDSPEQDWQGYQGYITQEIIVKEIPDYAERTFFVCGPPSMVTSLTGILQNDLQLPQEQIIVENFDGY